MSSYATVEQLRADMNLGSVSDDATLQRILDAAEIKINNLCNRPDGFVAGTATSSRYYRGKGMPYQIINECVEITEVAVKDSATDSAYTAWTTPTTMLAGDGDWIPATGSPVDPDFTMLPYTFLIIDPNGGYASFTGGKFTTRGGFRPASLIHRGVPTVRVTAKWGFSVLVPDDIKLACIMQSARWYKRLQSAMADVLASAEMGQLLYRLSLDPDIRGILEDGRYIRPTLG